MNPNDRLLLYIAIAVGIGCWWLMVHLRKEEERQREEAIQKLSKASETDPFARLQPYYNTFMGLKDDNYVQALCLLGHASLRNVPEIVTACILVVNKKTAQAINL